MFNMIMPHLEGARVLDLFAGTGALGLEALSRGADCACWVERDRAHFQILKRNVGEIAGERPGNSVICRDVFAFLKQQHGYSYDIILADPPYDRQDGEDTPGKVLKLIRDQFILAEGGIVVMEQAKEQDVVDSDHWSVLRDKVYGKTRVVIYKPVLRE
jgi:16S rRNA (guanine966-N2)-methyltransferase